MSTRKLALLAAIVSAFFLLAGCTQGTITELYNNDEKIASDTNTFGIGDVEQSITEQNYTAAIGQMEGMDTVWTYEAESDMELAMEYQITVDSGKVKLVLIGPDDLVTNLVESTPESDLSDYASNVVSLKKGLNRIKIVAGKNTKFNIDITILEGDFHELGF